METTVHCLPFAPYLDQVGRLSSWLTDDERQRAESFRFSCHQDRFVVSHAFARGVLGAYLHVQPRDVQILRSWTGKPLVGNTAPDGATLGFSLAHSTAYVAVAVAPTILVGVDVEQHRSGIDVPGIAERYFAPAEVAMLEGLSEAQAEAQFLRLWTCKEAFVKAIGLGLSYPLDRFVVGRPHHNQLEYSSVEAEYGPPSSWSLRTYRPAPECYVAVAVRLAEAVVDCCISDGAMVSSGGVTCPTQRRGGQFRYSSRRTSSTGLETQGTCQTPY
jgi:4'-phosphopantetheinyl transferase